MINDLIYCNDDDLTYEPQDEVLEWVEWDDLDNSWIDNLGNCYKTLHDIRGFAPFDDEKEVKPEDFKIFGVDNPKLNRYYLLPIND